MNLLPFIGLRGVGPHPCWSLVRLVLWRRHGLDLPDHHGVIDRGQALDAARNSGVWTRVETPRPGDVVVMETPVGGGAVAPLHVGIMATDTHVLHVDDHVGATSVCVPLSHDTVRRRIDSFWRHGALMKDQ